MKKFKFTPPVIVIAVLLVIAALSTAIKNSSMELPTMPTKTPIPTPKMAQLTYETEDLKNGWLRVSSDNYHFQVDVPNDLEISLGGFNINAPQEETVSMGFVPKGNSKFMFVLQIIESNRVDISTYKAIQVGNTKGYLNITDDTVDRSKVLHYYVANHGNYNSLTFSNWGSDITTSIASKQAIQKIVASFRVLN